MTQHGTLAEPSGAPPVADPILQVDGVSVEFGRMRALDQVTFEVQRGEITALIGPNGAGKTTMFNVIAGSLLPLEGQVLLQGEPLTGRQVHEVARSGLRRTFQNSRLLLDLSVLENVLVGMYVRAEYGWLSSMLRLPAVRRIESTLRKEALAALDEFGLADRAQHLAGSLPQGERRLLEIARNIAANPSIVLLDEPAAGLNEFETASLGDSLQHIRDRGVTVLLVEHDMQLVMERAHQIVVLSHGQLLTQGEPTAVQSDPRVIEAYLGSSRGRESDARDGDG